MDKLKELNTESLMMLSSYLMMFANEKTIKQCHIDINNIITERITRKEKLKECKIINLKKWREANEKERQGK